VESISIEGIVITSTVSAIRMDDLIFSYSRNMAGMVEDLPGDEFKRSARIK
jgi:hypothetical protein